MQHNVTVVLNLVCVGENYKIYLDENHASPSMTLGEGSVKDCLKNICIAHFTADPSNVLESAVITDVRNTEKGVIICYSACVSELPPKNGRWISTTNLNSPSLCQIVQHLQSSIKFGE